MSVNLNTRPSGYIKALAAVAPQSLTAAAADTGWVDVKAYLRLAALIALGAVADTATVAVTALQATSAAGAGSKELKINGASAVNYVGTDDNIEAMVDVDTMDVGFTHVKLTVTVAGAAAPALVAAALLGIQPRYETAPVPSTV